MHPSPHMEILANLVNPTTHRQKQMNLVQSSGIHKPGIMKIPEKDDIEAQKVFKAKVWNEIKLRQ